MEDFQESKKNCILRKKYNFSDSIVKELIDCLFTTKSVFESITDRFNHYIPVFIQLKGQYKDKIDNKIIDFCIIDFLFFHEECYYGNANDLKLFLKGCLYLIDKMNLDRECISDYMRYELTGVNDGTTGFDIIADFGEFNIDVFIDYYSRFEVNDDDLIRIIVKLNRRYNYIGTTEFDKEKLRIIIKNLKEYFDDNDEINIVETEF